MKKLILVFILTGGFNMAYANEYIKNNGVLSLSSDNGSAKFSINASHGSSSGVCNMEGVAESVGCSMLQGVCFPECEESSGAAFFLLEAPIGYYRTSDAVLSATQAQAQE